MNSVSTVTKACWARRAQASASASVEAIKSMQRAIAGFLVRCEGRLVPLSIRKKTNVVSRGSLRLCPARLFLARGALQEPVKHVSSDYLAGFAVHQILDPIGPEAANRPGSRDRRQSSGRC